MRNRLWSLVPVNLFVDEGGPKLRQFFAFACTLWNLTINEYRPQRLRYAGICLHHYSRGNPSAGARNKGHHRFYLAASLVPFFEVCNTFAPHVAAPDCLADRRSTNLQRADVLIRYMERCSHCRQDAGEEVDSSRCVSRRNHGHGERAILQEVQGCV